MRARRAYMEAIGAAGGAPVLIPAPQTDTKDTEITLTHLIAAYLDACSGVLLTGGADPATEPFGAPTHPRANRVHPDRQRFEYALLCALADRPDLPVLGICLGMQMMALCAGGELNQRLEDDTPTHAAHMDDRRHAVAATVGRSALWVGEAEPGAQLGIVTSWHRQAMRSPGSLRVVAAAPDGVVEALDNPDRPFHLGVQWHPERTLDPRLGMDLFRRFVAAAGQASARR